MSQATHHKSALPLALCLGIGAAIVLSVVSTLMYYQTGLYKLDLSRPGFEAQRENVDDDVTAKTYDTTSPVTKQSLDEFLSEYDSRTASLKTYGDFSDNSLSDEELILRDRNAQ